MTRTLTLAATLAVGTALPALAQGQDFGPLMTPAELTEAQSNVDPLVIDIRATEGAYADGHIEGSVNAPYSLFRGPSENPGQLSPTRSFPASSARSAPRPAVRQWSSTRART